MKKKRNEIRIERDMQRNSRVNSQDFNTCTYMQNTSLSSLAETFVNIFSTLENIIKIRFNILSQSNVPLLSQTFPLVLEFKIPGELFDPMSLKKIQVSKVVANFMSGEIILTGKEGDTSISLKEPSLYDIIFLDENSNYFGLIFDKIIFELKNRIEALKKIYYRFKYVMGDIVE